ncbi:MAG: hypothetical protein ABIS03_09965 [Gemmatimonadaceae bacterium]
MMINRHPPFAAPGQAFFTTPAERQVEEVLPSIQDFVDELPAIEDYLLGEPVAAEAERSTEADYASEIEVADGWAQSPWQSFDWSSAQALGPQGRGAAEQAWADSAWSPQHADQTPPPSAEEVAQALDGIAHRIRTGQLAIDTTPGTPPEAAIAAALVVLLRNRS